MGYRKSGLWAAAIGAAFLAAGAVTAGAAEAPQTLMPQETRSAPGSSELKALVAPAPAIGAMVVAQKGKGGGGQGNTVVVKKRSNKGAGVAAGIAALTAAAILLSAKPSRADNYRSNRASRYDCRRWRNRCEDGANWACRKLDREC